MYKDWFFKDTASYVILERAVPCNWDGFKPVQRKELCTRSRSLIWSVIHKSSHVVAIPCSTTRTVMLVIADCLVQNRFKKIIDRHPGKLGNILTGMAQQHPVILKASIVLNLG